MEWFKISTIEGNTFIETEYYTLGKIETIIADADEVEEAEKEVDKEGIGSWGAVQIAIYPTEGEAKMGHELIKKFFRENEFDASILIGDIGGKEFKKYNPKENR